MEIVQGVGAAGEAVEPGARRDTDVGEDAERVVPRVARVDDERKVAVECELDLFGERGAWATGGEEPPAERIFVTTGENVSLVSFQRNTSRCPPCPSA